MRTEKQTFYFETEGRASMEECIHLVAEYCLKEQISTMVMFTGTGVGPHYASKELLLRDQYKNLLLVAVTPPFGRIYKQNPADPDSPYVRSGINPAMRDELTALGIPVVSAHLPFKEMWDGRERRSEWTRVAEAYGVLGGGFALCIQATLMACDAGFVQHGDRVATLSADTALVVRACRTESFLSPLEGLLVEHIICRPARYTISKRIHETIAPREERPKPFELSTPQRARPIVTTGTESAAEQKLLPKPRRASAVSSKHKRAKLKSKLRTK
jgi:hypothetical protein